LTIFFKQSKGGIKRRRSTVELKARFDEENDNVKALEQDEHGNYHFVERRKEEEEIAVN
jgi:hypothetical protein